MTSTTDVAVHGTKLGKIKRRKIMSFREFIKYIKTKELNEAIIIPELPALKDDMNT
jgi:hypothetical protein